MVREVRIHGFEGKRGRATTVGNWANVYDPDQATPAEIVEAKLDGVCPRCGKAGEFGDEGSCSCGFAYYRWGVEDDD